MNGRKQKLELTWIGKENRPRLEPRVLVEDPERSHHAAHRVTHCGIIGNRLICEGAGPAHESRES